MAEELTKEQAQAVYDRGGRLLVSAAAGSGKTKVLVDRLLTYLTDQQAPANLDQFLIITYTKAAASELRGKIGAKLTQRIAQTPENRHLQKQMQRLFLTKISTVHGFCADLLREYAYRLDLPADFRVADENECREIREGVLNDLLEKAYLEAEPSGDFLAFADTQGLGRDDRLLPELIEQVYNSAMCHLDPEGWLDSCLEAVSPEQTDDAAQTIWGRYLLEDLHRELDIQIAVMEKCAGALGRSPGMEKPQANLTKLVAQLTNLRSLDTWDAVCQAGAIDYGVLSFPRKNVDEALKDQVKAAREACKGALSKKLQSFSDLSAQVLADLNRSAAGSRGLVALVRQFRKDYAEEKRRRRCVDFNDLEQKTLDLLLGKTRSGPTAAAVEIGNRYREILVDEYQDSNGVQDAIFTALTQRSKNGFFVGDVKQSIYQFRLADPGIFLEKYHSYLPADQAQPGQGRKVLLSHNFRSGIEVIQGVNDVFSACMSPEVGGLYYTQDEALREGIPHGPLPDAGVELYAIETEADAYAGEAAFVAQRIDTMLREGTVIRDAENFRPVQAKDIVILLRSPSSAGQVFQKALEARGIRCSTGSGVDLLQTEEVATFRGLLQTILNPRQDIPLLTTLASPVFGFAAEDLASIRSHQRQGCIYEALQSSKMEKAQNFLALLQQLRQAARYASLSALLEQCYCLTRLDSIYAAMADGEVKSANLQAFYQLALDFETGSRRDLSQFLEHLAAMEDRGLIREGSGAADSVTIMSIHKSKGLEFPVVFLCNLSRRFNMESTNAQILCDNTLGLGLSIADPQLRIRYPSIAKRAIALKMRKDSVSEELRVLYVAMTRARDRLIMTYASSRLEKRLQELCLRMAFDWQAGLCREAGCMGDWILLTALGRTEAGALHLGGCRPEKTQTSPIAWKIALVPAPEVVQKQQQQLAARPALPEEICRQLEKSLAFVYPHRLATATPSKLTATSLKGRVKDMEAAENSRQDQLPQRTWRQPAFSTGKIQGKVYGNAIHAAMQYLQYSSCTSQQTVAQELERLVKEKFLTPEQGQMVSPEKIARFFQTPVGQALSQGVPSVREFKFSILQEGSRYDPALEGEQILMQGVVDCALLEPEGITVVDFKTDRVTPDTLEAVVARYRTQVETYCDAMARIFQKPIRASYLYFFHIDQLIHV